MANGGREGLKLYHDGTPVDGDMSPWEDYYTQQRRLDVETAKGNRIVRLRKPKPWDRLLTRIRGK